MIRMTTGGVMKTYRSNLMNSFISQSKAMNTILTNRNFNSFAEDPAVAAKAFRLRKSRMTVESQYNICTDTLKKHQAGFSCLQSIDEVLDTRGGMDGSFMKTLKGATLEWLNDTNGGAREQLTKAFSQMSELLIQNMNQKYGDNFIFAGADGHNVPFEITESGLTYRGIPVDAYQPDLMMDGANRVEVKLNGAALPEKTYLVAGTETIPAADLPKLSPDNNNPNLIVGTDGNHYYTRDPAPTPMTGADFQAKLDQIEADLTAAGKTPGEIEAAQYEERQKYVATSTLGPAYEDDTLTYYAKDDLILKDEYDKINNNIMRDENGNAYTVSIKGQDCYIIQGKKDPFITEEAYNKAGEDAKKLEYLSKREKEFVDVGLGFQENEDGKLIESSGFDAALVGINFIGYGVDEDGDPKNLYSLVQKMKEVSDSVPEGSDWPTDVWNEFDRLVGKFETACSNFKTEFVNTDAGVTKLENQEKLLNEDFYNLVEQYSDLEDIDMVEAINSFLWAQYSYNAALKVGNSVLSQSLMDYLN